MKKSKISESKKDILRLQKSINEWQTKYMRALADYQNLEKRSAEEKKKIRQYAAEEVITHLLPIIDTIEKAYEHLQDQGLRYRYRLQVGSGIGP